MPRIARKDNETSFFHIIVQGINKEYIFDTSARMEKYIQLLKTNSKKENLEILAYCIMSNHAHILVYIENISNMSKVMQKVNTVYAMLYNKDKKRVGYVFRDRYFTQPILNETQLFNCIVYIHNNPVSAKMVEKADKYKYSTYNQYINKEVTDEVLKLIFGSSRNYLDAFIQIHMNENVEDVKDIWEDYENYEIVMQEYFKEELKDIDEIKHNTDIFTKLIIDLKNRCGLSLREISKLVKVNKDKVSAILKQYNIK